MISEQQAARYHEDGFIVVEDVFSQAEVDELRQVTDSFVEAARQLTAHDDIYDLEPSHTPGDPRVRRIKAPHLRHPAYDRAMRNPNLLAVLAKLIGPAIRADTSKLNMKAPGYGAAVEWHQDWAFYPHTNDDLLAVGVMMDDMADENGPLLCVPGSHKGPVLNHHDDEGYFCGAIDPTRGECDLSQAVACNGPAGSISVHHVRTIHGSALNVSNRPRRLLLFQYRAADAWPLVPATMPKSIEAWNELLLCGDTVPVAPRVAPVPVRLPLPPALHQGSIYENQRSLKNAWFSKAPATAM